MTTGKTIALTRRTFVGKVMSLLFNMLARSVITFLSRSNCLLISWLQSPTAVILEPTKNKVSHCFPTYLPWSDGTRCYDLSFLNVEVFFFLSFNSFWFCHTLTWMLSFMPIYSFSSFTFIKRLSSSSWLSDIRVVSSAYLRLLVFLLAMLILACNSSSPAFLMMYSA